MLNALNVCDGDFASSNHGGRIQLSLYVRQGAHWPLRMDQGVSANSCLHSRLARTDQGRVVSHISLPEEDSSVAEVNSVAYAADD
jgi:hypothetical protein